MLDDLSFDFSSLRAAYNRGLRPTALVEECFRRLDQVGDPGIFLHLSDRAALLAEAAALGERPDASRPLWGIPFAVKDNIDVAGAPTTAACPEFAYVAGTDAAVVALLRAAGALLIGKTNMDQFATGLVGVRSPFPPPRNAVDPAMVPGGSSSGSAVAVAHGIVAFALGTDTAGSGRVPAGLNNIVGLKPSLGALSATGLVPACRTLDTISVFALTVADSYDVLHAAARFDATDPFSRPLSLAPLGQALPRPRVAIPDAAGRRFFGDEAQERSFADTVARLHRLGAEIVEIDFSAFHAIAEMLYGGTWVAERHSVVADLMDTKPDALLPVIRAVINPATKFSATDAFRDQYKLRALRRAAELAMAGTDMLCVPTMPTFCTLDEIAADPIGPNARLGTYTNFVNLIDLCGTAVPVAARDDGRPGGVTLLGRHGADAQVAAWAQKLQDDCAAPLGATGKPLPIRVGAPTGQARDGEFAVAVAGAHMSGLPLNGELTRLGARFIRKARTAPEYRMVHLAGSAVAKPGMEHTGDGSLALEIWALPAARLADFMAAIPAPMCIGTLSLDDGSSVKGFLCEHHAIIAGTDVTQHGGWRTYLDTLG